MRKLVVPEVNGIALISYNDQTIYTIQNFFPTLYGILFFSPKLLHKFDVVSYELLTYVSFIQLL